MPQITDQDLKTTADLFAYSKWQRDEIEHLRMVMERVMEAIGDSDECGAVLMLKTALARNV